MSQPTDRHAAAPGDLPSWAFDRLEAVHAEQERVEVELELAQGKQVRGTLVGVRSTDGDAGSPGGVVRLEGAGGGAVEEIDAADVVAYSLLPTELP